MNSEMLLRFSVLLMVGVVQCSDDQMFERKTVSVGENVTLTCNIITKITLNSLFWIRLVSGNVPEVVGATFSFEHEGHDNKMPHITAKVKNELFILKITEANHSDTGLYYCTVVQQLDMKFMKGILLKVKGPEPNVTSVIQVFAPDRAHPGDPVTLQCSVLFGTKPKTCPGEDSVYWYRAASDQSQLHVVYTDGKNDGKCEKSPTSQKCIYNFRASDDGTYYCAVATCGHIFFGNGTKLDIEDSQETTKVLYLLVAALATSVTVIIILISKISKKRCHLGNVAISQQTQLPATNGDRQSQRSDALLVYAAPAFNKRKDCKPGQRQRNERSAEVAVTYSGVRGLVQNNK
ncbi:uncharacterized protein LOC117520071 [Thalassophryne amazonica]|uniref:uncharacterized protein LOC117520071 n=1 Tax=Thalassophryne amazonica TaxID=390379 RepID=UPI001470933D|nr:uncharacterized protein LOC117520071 [Thalassophryne amazonica]